MARLLAEQGLPTSVVAGLAEERGWDYRREDLDGLDHDGDELIAPLRGVNRQRSKEIYSRSAVISSSTVLAQFSEGMRWVWPSVTFRSRSMARPRSK